MSPMKGIRFKSTVNPGRRTTGAPFDAYIDEWFCIEHEGKRYHAHWDFMQAQGKTLHDVLELSSCDGSCSIDLSSELSERIQEKINAINTTQ